MSNGTASTASPTDNLHGGAPPGTGTRTSGRTRGRSVPVPVPVPVRDTVTTARLRNGIGNRQTSTPSAPTVMGSDE